MSADQHVYIHFGMSEDRAGIDVEELQRTLKQMQGQIDRTRAMIFELSEQLKLLRNQ